MPQLFTYIIPYDDGAAPHPFGGICTLAICKPTIRRTARVGDWAAGFGSKNAPNGLDLSGRLVYAMKVTEVLSMRDYDVKCRASWQQRIPDIHSLELSRRLGDCIYDYSGSQSTPKQRLGVHGTGNIDRDLSGERVLVSTEFYYFGSNPIKVPNSLSTIVPLNQGHQRPKNQPHVSDFIQWINGQGKPAGMHGWPHILLPWLKVNAPSIQVGGCAVRASDADVEYA